MANETWPGIVVRCDPSERGTVPRATGAQSPDIILSGNTPFDDPSMLLNPENYGKAFDNPLYVGRPNYIYLRGRNFTARDQTGVWSLYFAAPNILLWPGVWINNRLSTASGDANPRFAVAAGKIGATLTPFMWVPPNGFDQPCFVALAATPDHGNPLAGVTSIDSLAEILANNANIALRNVKVILGNVPDAVFSLRYEQGTEAARMDLATVFRNMPRGSSYTIAADTPLNGRILQHSESNTLNPVFKFSWINLDIPAQWTATFTISLTFGSDWSGIPKGAYPSVELRGELVVDTRHRLYHLGHDAEPYPESAPPRHEQGAPVRVVTVGSVTTILPDVGPK